MKLEYKDFLCKYDSYYIKWNGIGFDKDKLILFVKRIKWLKFISIFIPSKKEELKILTEIYNSYDEKTLQGLLNNEENASRKGLIEKWARIAAIDLLLTGVYHRTTFTTISNLPIKDYQLVLKRVEEMIKLHKEITHQSDNITNDIPGL